MNNRRAFTLVELLLATVLSTVLMIGVLAVITDLGAPASQIASTTTQETDGIEAWTRLLREDLAHAGAISLSKGSAFTLTGYGALDTQRGQRTHRPVQVTYQLEQIDGRLWLVRRQESLDVLTNQNIQRELVCSGVTRFELTPERGTADGHVIQIFAPTAPIAREDSAGTGATGMEAEGDPARPRGITHDYRVDHNIGYVAYAHQDEDASQTSEGDSKTGPTPQAEEEAEEAPDATDTQDAADQPSQGMVLRLRVWTDDRDEPAATETFLIHPNGGA